jgi:hypothetical protein
MTLPERAAIGLTAFVADITAPPLLYVDGVQYHGPDLFTVDRDRPEPVDVLSPSFWPVLRSPTEDFTFTAVWKIQRFTQVVDTERSVVDVLAAALQVEGIPPTRAVAYAHRQLGALLDHMIAQATPASARTTGE